MEFAAARFGSAICATLLISLAATLVAGCSGSREGPATVPVTVTLTASAADVYSGLDVRLSWTSTGVTSCEAYGSWSGTRQPSGVEGVFPPLAVNLFGLSCMGPGGTAQASAVVTVTIPRYRANSLSPMQEGFAINNRGDVVGKGGGVARGFIDNHEVLIGHGTPCTPQCFLYQAIAINGQRTVLYLYSPSVMSASSYAWQYGGGPAPAIPPASYIFHDINEFGEIVASQTSGVQAEVLIRQGERIELTGACTAWSINDRGHITGSMRDATGYCNHLLFFADGVAHDLGQFPGASSTRGTAINFTDTIVGYADSPSGVRAFRYTAAQGYTDLGSLGGSETRAFDINSAGKAVGYSTLPGSSQLRRAFLFTEERLVDLNDYVDDPQALFSPLSIATAISDAGWIVANACRSNGDCIAYLLTPVFDR